MEEDQERRDGWWLASDGRWYPPELHPDRYPSDSVDRPPSSEGRAGRSAAERAEQLRGDAEKWDKGAEGEHQTARRLRDLPTGYVALHDLHVPGSTANIDHLVIGPTGVFVVDSKAHAGTYRSGNGTLWRGRYPIRKELRGAQSIAQRVSDHLDADASVVLCFTQATLPLPVNRLDGGMAVTLAALPSVVTAGPEVHSPAMVEWLTRLARELEQPTAAAPSRSRPDSGRSSGPTPERASANGGLGRASQRVETAPSATKQRSMLPGCRAVVGLLMILLLALILLAAGLTGLSKALPSTTTAGLVPPGVHVAFKCRTPGSGYSAVFTYPSTGSSQVSYDVVIAYDGTELLRETWQSKYAPAPTLDGLWPGVGLTVLTTETGGTAAARQWVATPSEPC